MWMKREARGCGQANFEGVALWNPWTLEKLQDTTETRSLGPEQRGLEGRGRRCRRQTQYVPPREGRGMRQRLPGNCSHWCARLAHHASAYGNQRSINQIETRQGKCVPLLLIPKMRPPRLAVRRTFSTIQMHLLDRDRAGGRMSRTSMFMPLYPRECWTPRLVVIGRGG